MPPARRALVAASAAVLILTACGSSDRGGAEGDRLRIQASFYPLAWIAEQIGGDAVQVSSLTPPGTEPHDLELSPAAVADLSEADLVVYLRGFQPAVDEAVGQLDEDRKFDAAGSTRLDLTFTAIEEGEEATDEAGATDPHFWLDPDKLSEVADDLAERLGQADPRHARDYTTRATTLSNELSALDRDLEAGLGDCRNKEVVTSHDAFGYLAERYGLTQVGITGLTPEDEPTPRQLARVTRFVEEHEVRTIYFESLVPADIAETVAAETGAATAVLDPLEGLSEDSAGDDYIEVMQANLETLRAGQRCP